MRLVIDRPTSSSPLETTAAVLPSPLAAAPRCQTHAFAERAADGNGRTRPRDHRDPLYNDGEVWKTSDRFGRDGLPLVCETLGRGHAWLSEHTRKGA